VFAIPCLWVGIERVPWLFNYTWLHLGNAGIDMDIPMRLAPVTGVYGLSWVFSALGTALAVVLFRRERRQIVWLAPIAVLIALPALPAPERGGESAVSVQPNIPERDDWTQELALSTQQQMEYLSLQSALAMSQPKPRLILWPEVPAPLYYFDDAPFRERVNSVARLTGAHVLIGTVAYNDRKAPQNTAVFVKPDGSAGGRYDKMFLVPFGEYIPFPFGRFLGPIASEIGDFVPGERTMVFDAGPVRVGPFICYESAFPHLVRELVTNGATVLANLSNDGYFGGAAAREQHLSLVRMRAAENRRWILRSTNDGITAAVDPGGRVVTAMPEWQVTAGRLPFNSRTDLTLYTRTGDAFAWTCAGLSVLLLALSQLPSYRRG
jgi:apolipoprotein N-acyltransferase